MGRAAEVWNNQGMLVAIDPTGLIKALRQVFLKLWEVWKYPLLFLVTSAIQSKVGKPPFHMPEVRISEVKP